MAVVGAVKLVCATCGQGNRVPVSRLSEGPRCGTCGAALADGKVAELDQTLHDKVTGGDGLAVLIDYWAPWCGPCRMMAPEFAKAARDLGAEVRFMKLNTEQYPDVSARAGIRGIPALILYRGGREIARLAGYRPASEIVAFARQHAGG
jgi:thioredoxin 2